MAQRPMLYRHPTRARAKDQHGKIPAVFVSFIRQKYQTENKETEASNPEDVLRRRYYIWEKGSVTASGIATVVIAVVAIVSAGIAKLQWDALRIADETTRESFTAIQRPFVTASLDIRRGMPLYWEFQVFAQNSGNTPTRALEYISIETSNPTDPEDAFINPPDPIYQRWRGLIGPKDRVALVGTYIGRPFSTIQKLVDDRSQFFISGVVHYRGPFSRSPYYFTKFCFAVTAVNENNTVQPVYQPCLYWNCADDDCKADKAAYWAALKAANPQLK